MTGFCNFLSVSGEGVLKTENIRRDLNICKIGGGLAGAATRARESTPFPSVGGGLEAGAGSREKENAGYFQPDYDASGATDLSFSPPTPHLFVGVHGLQLCRYSVTELSHWP